MLFFVKQQVIFFGESTSQNEKLTNQIEEPKKPIRVSIIGTRHSERGAQVYENSVTPGDKKLTIAGKAMAEQSASNYASFMSKKHRNSILARDRIKNPSAGIIGSQWRRTVATAEINLKKHIENRQKYTEQEDRIINAPVIPEPIIKNGLGLAQFYKPKEDKTNYDLLLDKVCAGSEDEGIKLHLFQALIEKKGSHLDGYSEPEAFNYNNLCMNQAKIYLEAFASGEKEQIESRPDERIEDIDSTDFFLGTHQTITASFGHQILVKMAEIYKNQDNISNYQKLMSSSKAYAKAVGKLGEDVNAGIRLSMIKFPNKNGEYNEKITIAINIEGFKTIHTVSRKALEEIAKGKLADFETPFVD